MTKEDKELLLKDLSGRLPYSVQVQNITEGRECIKGSVITISKYVPYSVHILTDFASGNQEYSPIEHIKPYLRSMSSMTSEECAQLSVLLPRYFTVYPDCLYCTESINGGLINFEVLDTITDFYNSHHLDWRGLIPKGLALEAPKDMYKI